MYVMFFNFIEKYWQNQFPTTILWSFLIILDHPSSSLYILESFGILTYFWKLLDTFGYFWDILEICWRSIIRVSSVIISYIQQICTILTFQYVSKTVFSGLQTIKVTFFILHYFPVVSPRCVSPFFLPVVSPQCVSPFLGRSPWASLSAFPLKKSKRMETDGYNMKQNENKWNRATFKIFEIEGVDSEHLEPLGSIKLKCIRQDGQEQLEYSGQLSIKKGWGAWFYRRPTNPPNHLREWLGGIDSIEIVNLKIPWGLWFYRCIFGKGGHVLLIYHYKIVNTNPFT